MSVNGVIVSADEAETFRNMRPSVVFSIDDAAHDEFMRIVEGGDESAGGQVADERLARLFERPSPFGQHVELDS